MRMAKQRVGMLGLGIMGSAMAGNLLRAGFPVVGYDPLPACRRRLSRAGGTPLATVEDMDAALVITSLPSAQALHRVTGKLQNVRIVLETSTLPIAEKEKARKHLASR